MTRHRIGSAIGVVLLAACAPAGSHAPTPESWQHYDDLDDLQDDATVVVTGVAQRVDDKHGVQFSVSETLRGEPPVDDPLWIDVGGADPVELQPGFRYILYLRDVEAEHGAFTVVGPGAWEQPPGSPDFAGQDRAPAGLPDRIDEADVAG